MTSPDAGSVGVYAISLMPLTSSAPDDPAPSREEEPAVTVAEEDPVPPDVSLAANEERVEEPAPAQIPVTIPAPPAQPMDVARAEPPLALTNSAASVRERPAALPPASGAAMVAEVPREATDPAGRGPGPTGGAPDPEPVAGESLSTLSYWSKVSQAILSHLRYPARAQREGLEGLVRLKVTIDTRGRVVAVSSLASSADESLRVAAVKAVYRASPFPSPVADDTADVPLTAEIPVRFRLL